MGSNYNKINTILGWLVCAIATITYCSTIEPTASFWDCGEYIACSYKLEVGHPPGAPFFLLIARFFSLFAMGDVTKAAMWINIMSALASSFSILFLFWSITRLAKKVFLFNKEELNTGRMIAIFGAGIVGSLAYTFSDSFWFSAVEGEVYAMSSFFTAVVFWAILKWEEEADEKGNMRWIVLISYLVGLSIGVHLLNLLVVPAICYIYFYKKFPFSWKGFLITGVVSIFLLGFIQNGIIPGIVKFAADFELFFVNKAGLSFNSGISIYFILLVGFLVTGTMYTLNQSKKMFQIALVALGLLALFGILSSFMPENSGGDIFFRLVVLAAFVGLFYYLKDKIQMLNLIMISLTVLLIGYSSFFVLVIRSQANTPMDENDPENPISLLSYLNREQYGDSPLLYGQYYNSPRDKQNPAKDGKPVYARSEKDGKYVITDDRKGSIPMYEKEFCTVFPRMWSEQRHHVDSYQYWGDIKGRAKTYVNREGQTETIVMPTFYENMTYFFNYQVGYMYWRYFFWNFIGRQNDVQGLNNNASEGNWISGIPAWDKNHLKVKNLDIMPTQAKNNKGTNKFYAIPFLLGLLGIWYHVRKQGRDAFVVLVLFFFTGLAIVVYLNQYPYQPRERDYAFAASFYAFAIWIGFGVLALYDLLEKIAGGKNAAIVGTLVGCIAPYLMAAEGWDDHNRSFRTMSRDFAINYLQSCEKNAILFTNGDNDTFPLWYAQEVEGIRTDVRVVNLSLLQTDWYINQMRKKVYDSDPVPFTLKPERYVQGTRDVVYVDKNTKVGYASIKELMSLHNEDDPSIKADFNAGKLVDIFPTNKFYIPVDSAKVVNNGTVSKSMAHRIVKSVNWELNKSYVFKNDLLVLDLLAGFNWNRPIYFAVTTGNDAYLNLESYLQLEGMAYRLVPIKSERNEMQGGSLRVNTDAMYKNIMEKFQWGGMKKEGVYLDETCMRMASNMRIHMATLAMALLEKNEKTKAVKVLDKAMEEIPTYNVPVDGAMFSLVQAYFQAGEQKKAAQYARLLFDAFENDLRFYNQLDASRLVSYEREVKQAKAILMQLGGLAAMHNDKALADEFNKRIQNVVSSQELQEMMQ